MSTSTTLSPSATTSSLLAAVPESSGEAEDNGQDDVAALWVLLGISAAVVWGLPFVICFLCFCKRQLRLYGQARVLRIEQQRHAARDKTLLNEDGSPASLELHDEESGDVVAELQKEMEHLSGVVEEHAVKAQKVELILQSQRERVEEVLSEARRLFQEERGPEALALLEEALHSNEFTDKQLSAELSDFYALSANLSGEASAQKPPEVQAAVQAAQQEARERRRARQRRREMAEVQVKELLEAGLHGPALQVATTCVWDLDEEEAREAEEEKRAAQQAVARGLSEAQRARLVAGFFESAEELAMLTEAEIDRQRQRSEERRAERRRKLREAASAAQSQSNTVAPQQSLHDLLGALRAHHEAAQETAVAPKEQFQARRVARARKREVAQQKVKELQQGGDVSEAAHELEAILRELLASYASDAEQTSHEASRRQGKLQQQQSRLSRQLTAVTGVVVTSPQGSSGGALEASIAAWQAGTKLRDITRLKQPQPGPKKRSVPPLRLSPVQKMQKVIRQQLRPVMHMRRLLRQRRGPLLEAHHREMELLRAEYEAKLHALQLQTESLSVAAPQPRKKVGTKSTAGVLVQQSTSGRGAKHATFDEPIRAEDQQRQQSSQKQTQRQRLQMPIVVGRTVDDDSRRASEEVPRCENTLLMAAINEAEAGSAAESRRPLHHGGRGCQRGVSFSCADAEEILLEATSPQLPPPVYERHGQMEPNKLLQPPTASILGRQQTTESIQTTFLDVAEEEAPQSTHQQQRRAVPDSPGNPRAAWND